MPYQEIFDVLWLTLAFCLFILAVADYKSGNKQDAQIEILVAIFFLLVGKY